MTGLKRVGSLAVVATVAVVAGTRVGEARDTNGRSQLVAPSLQPTPQVLPHRDDNASDPLGDAMTKGVMAATEFAAKLHAQTAAVSYEGAPAAAQEILRANGNFPVKCTVYIDKERGMSSNMFQWGTFSPFEDVVPKIKAALTDHGYIVVEKDPTWYVDVGRHLTQYSWTHYALSATMEPSVIIAMGDIRDSYYKCGVNLWMTEYGFGGALIEGIDQHGFLRRMPGKLDASKTFTLFPLLYGHDYGDVVEACHKKQAAGLVDLVRNLPRCSDARGTKVP